MNASTVFLTMSDFVDYYRGAFGQTLIIRITRKETAVKFMQGLRELATSKRTCMSLDEIGVNGSNSKRYFLKMASVIGGFVESGTSAVVLKGNANYWQNLVEYLPDVGTLVQVPGHQYFEAIELPKTPVVIEISVYE